PCARHVLLGPPAQWAPISRRDSGANARVFRHLSVVTGVGHGDRRTPSREPTVNPGGDEESTGGCGALVCPRAPVEGPGGGVCRPVKLEQVSPPVKLSKVPPPRQFEDQGKALPNARHAAFCRLLGPPGVASVLHFNNRS